LTTFAEEPKLWLLEPAASSAEAVGALLMPKAPAEATVAAVAVRVPMIFKVIHSSIVAIVGGDFLRWVTAGICRFYDPYVMSATCRGSRFWASQ
jgi:hypothetical protein